MSKIDIRNLLKDTLLDYGFKKTGNLFFKEIDENTFSTINYGEGHWNSGHTIIFPNIGIGYLNVDKLYANLCGIKYRKCPILLQGLYDWMGTEDREGYRKDCKKWEFIDNGRNDEVLAEMFSVIFKYAEPFWKEMSDFNNLFNVVFNRTRLIYNHTEECLLPIFYYLRGEKEKGLEYIEEIKKHGVSSYIKDFTSNYNRNLSYLDFAKRYEQLP